MIYISMKIKALSAFVKYFVPSVEVFVFRYTKRSIRFQKGKCTWLATSYLYDPNRPRDQMEWSRSQGRALSSAPSRATLGVG